MKTAKHTVLILSLICVIPLLFSCASGRGISASDVRAGMSSDKLYCMLGTYGVYYGHDGDRLLFRDKKNRSVTVEFSEDMKTVAAVTSAAAAQSCTGFTSASMRPVPSAKTVSPSIWVCTGRMVRA